jgi:hypothetical protein
MPSTATFHESRRSTRVPLKVVITVEGGAESRTCEGETIVVNLHGALIATAIGLSSRMRISIHVYLTDKRAAARVVYTDPKNPLRCGIELDSYQQTRQSNQQTRHDPSPISNPWLKSTTLVKPGHRRLANRRLSELLCLS